MSVRSGPPYEYKNNAHRNSSEGLDQAFRMLRLGRQPRVKSKKLPPLAIAVDFGQPRPAGHLTAHPGSLALGIVASLLLGGGQGFGA